MQLNLLIKKFTIALIMGSILILTSCGPMYQTRYNYTPPASFDGRKCVNGCLQNKSKCMNSCSKRYNECTLITGSLSKVDSKVTTKCSQHKTSANGIQKTCDTTKVGTGVNSNFLCQEEQKNCKNECNSTYDSCYTNCGGNIRSYQVCVAFCNQ